MPSDAVSTEASKDTGVVSNDHKLMVLYSFSGK
jgi:hypothetical protein